MLKLSCASISPKRYLLPFVGILGFLYLEEVRNFIYIPLLISPTCIIIFWNFPKLVYFTNSKPLYYEDLFIDERKLPNYDVNKDIKKKYRQILCWSFIITNSLFLGGLAEYWFYRTHNSTSYMEIIGITGGIIRVFQMINTLIGKIILWSIRRQVRKDNIRLKQKTSQKFKRMIYLLKQMQTNRWESIETPKDDNNIVATGDHHIEIITPRERSSTF